MLCSTTACLLAALPLAALAQEYSFDGNRWYEIELLVFRQDAELDQISEQPLAEQGLLEYLPQVRELRPAISSYLVDFSKLQAPAQAEAAAVLPENPAPRPFLPPYSPAASTPYRLDDFSRQPYIALDDRFWGMTRDLQRLQDSPDYQVLWHGLWRQPMQGAAQTPSVAVLGGSRLGNHYELEGSTRFVDRDGQIELQLNLWLSQFSYSEDGALSHWLLPPNPFASLEPAAQSPLSPDFGFGEPGLADPWQAELVWQLQSRQAVSATQYYYLDNPAFGVLLQLRPYQLPARSLDSAEPDF